MASTGKANLLLAGLALGTEVAPIRLALLAPVEVVGRFSHQFSFGLLANAAVVAAPFWRGSWLTVLSDVVGDYWGRQI